MGCLVSSRYDYIENHAGAQLSYKEVEHELQYIGSRERASGLLAAGSLVVALLGMAGVIPGGAFLVGALLAIAAVAASYAYCCRSAEMGLRDRQATWFIKNPNPPATKNAAPLPPSSKQRA